MFDFSLEYYAYYYVPVVRCSMTSFTYDVRKIARYLVLLVLLEATSS